MLAPVPPLSRPPCCGKLERIINERREFFFREKTPFFFSKFQKKKKNISLSLFSLSLSKLSSLSLLSYSSDLLTISYTFSLTLSAPRILLS